MIQSMKLGTVIEGGVALNDPIPIHEKKRRNHFQLKKNKALEEILDLHRCKSCEANFFYRCCQINCKCKAGI